MRTRHSRIITDGQFVLALWSMLYVLVHPLWITGLWVETPCAMHGGACTCPERCRLIQAESIASTPLALPACHHSDTKVIDSHQEAAPSLAAPCEISSACRSDQDPAVSVHGYRFLPTHRTVWIYVPVIQRCLLGERIYERAGFPPALFHPPEA